MKIYNLCGLVRCNRLVRACLLSALICTQVYGYDLCSRQVIDDSFASTNHTDFSDTLAVIFARHYRVMQMQIVQSLIAQADRHDFKQELDLSKIEGFSYNQKSNNPFGLREPDNLFTMYSSKVSIGGYERDKPAFGITEKFILSAQHRVHIDQTPLQDFSKKDKVLILAGDLASALAQSGHDACLALVYSTLVIFHHEVDCRFCQNRLPKTYALSPGQCDTNKLQQRLAQSVLLVIDQQDGHVLDIIFPDGLKP